MGWKILIKPTRYRFVYIKEKLFQPNGGGKSLIFVDYVDLINLCLYKIASQSNQLTNLSFLPTYLPLVHLISYKH